MTEKKDTPPKMKTVLANTPLKVSRLLKRLDKALLEESGFVGFDTEVEGPLLQGRDFVNRSYSALLGLSVAFEDNTSYYLPIRHRGNNASFMDLHNVCEVLIGLAAAGRLWAHNAEFDFGVMQRAGYSFEGLRCSKLAAWLVLGKNKGIGLKELAKVLLDRESPAYDPTIGKRTAAEVLEYACHDAINTRELGVHFFPKLESMKLVEWFDRECEFGRALSEMHTAGIRLNRDKLREARNAADEKKSAAGAEWAKHCPDISITSSKQLQKLFESGLWRTETMTKTGNYSTSADTMREQIANKTPGAHLAQLRLDYQEVNKVVNTYTDGLIEESLQHADKKLHPDLFHLGTVTGRLSSSNPNIQNQPSHGEWSKLIKECFIPEPCFEFTSADYSQIELRYFADYCGGNLLAAFVEGKDLHQETADGLGIDRPGGKTVNFGFLLYGGGPKKLARTVGVPESEGQALLDKLQAKYPRVEAWRRHVIAIAEKRGPIPWVKTRAGRLRFIPELQPEKWKVRDRESYMALARHLVSKYNMGPNAFKPRFGPNGAPRRSRVDSAIWSRGCRLVVNYLIQGGSRDLLVLAMNEYRRRAPEGFSLVTTVHDEILTTHPAGRGEEGRALLKACMEDTASILKLKVPVIAEPKTGPNWFEVK